MDVQSVSKRCAHRVDCKAASRVSQRPPKVSREDLLELRTGRVFVVDCGGEVTPVDMDANRTSS